MSPEQARGDEVDARSDIFSFGSLLYEMTTEKRAFDGKGTGILFDQILNREPVEAGHVNPNLPEGLGAIIRKTLKKDRDFRYQSIRDVAVDLKRVGQGVELAPDAVTTRTRSATTRRSQAKSRSVWTVSVTGIAAAISVWWSLFRDEPAQSPPARESKQEPLLASSSGTAEEVEVAAEAEETVIAVLPFDILGAGDDVAAFTSGLHNDVLAHLSRIKAFKTISRISVMEYAEKKENVREIARELGVNRILDGGVQRAGNRVRISLQLIDAAKDTQVWGRTYDRELTVSHIFDVQSEIATDIAQALDADISPSAATDTPKQPTGNLQAYDFYLRGMEYRNRPGNRPEDIGNAIMMFDRALELDPDFAPALATRSTNVILGGNILVETDPNLARKLAEDSEYAEAVDIRMKMAEKALELDPDLPEGHFALGYTFLLLGQLDQALGELDLAAEGLPGDYDVARSRTAAYRAKGDIERAVRVLEEAADFDPRNSDLFFALGRIYRNVKRFDDARGAFDHTLSVAPDHLEAQYYRAHLTWIGYGDTSDLSAYLEGIGSHVTTVGGLAKNDLIYWRWLVEYIDRDFDQALEVLTNVPYDIRFEAGGKRSTRGTLIGLTHHVAGNSAAAAAAFETVREEMERKIASVGPNQRQFARYHMSLGFALAGLGRKHEAIAASSKAVDLFGWADYVLMLGEIYTMVGEAEAAAEQVDRAISGHSVFSFRMIEKNPVFDGIRNHPAWKKLERKYL